MKWYFGPCGRSLIACGSCRSTACTIKAPLTRFRSSSKSAFGIWSKIPSVVAYDRRSVRFWSLARLRIRLRAEVEERLAALAKATGRTKTSYVRQAILEHLDALEDLYLVEQRLIELRAGRITTRTLEDVECDLGMAD